MVLRPVGTLFAIVCLVTCSLAMACLTMGCLSRPDEREIELSYSERPGLCDGCASFELTFRSGGSVEFRGLTGCALPGRHHYRIAAAEWESLVRAFRNSDFFTTPRRGPQVFDATVITVAYRDNRKVHETIDTSRDDANLSSLEKRLRDAGRIQPWITPTPELYRKALAEGWDVNTRNDDGENALTCAAMEGGEDAARVLLDAGSTISPLAFQTAPLRMDVRMLRLLDEAAPLDVHGALASEVLVAATRNPDALRYLLDRGVPVNARDRNGRTVLLSLRQEAGDLATLAFLLSKGADPNVTGPGGESPLYRAAGALNSGFITTLAGAGVDVDQPLRNGVTPLLHAAEMCMYWNVSALIEAGADPRPAAMLFQRTQRTSHPGVADNCRKTQEVLARAVTSPRTTHIGPHPHPKPDP